MEIQTIKFHSFIMEMSVFQQRYGAEKDGHHNLVSGLSKFREFVEQHCMLWTCFTVFCDLSQLLRALYLVLFSLQLSFAHIFSACCAQRPISLWQFFGLKVAFLLPVFGFSVEPLVSLSEGSLHHDPSIYIQLLDVHLLAWDPGSWYGDYGCLQKWRIQTEWWWIQKTPTPRNAQCMGYLYLNLISNKTYFPSHQLDVKLSWMVIIGTLDLQKPQVFKVANTTIGSPAALWSFNLCWCSEPHFCYESVLVGFRCFEESSEKTTWNTHHSSMGPLYKSSMRTPKKKHDPFFWGGGWGVLWEEILGYHFAKKERRLNLYTKR